jgi:hypothetical protein
MHESTMKKLNLILPPIWRPGDGKGQGRGRGPWICSDGGVASNLAHMVEIATQRLSATMGSISSARRWGLKRTRSNAVFLKSRPL